MSGGWKGSYCMNSISDKPASVKDFALTTLRVLPREIVQQGGSTYWLEPAEPLACERVIAKGKGAAIKLFGSPIAAKARVCRWARAA